MHASCAWLLTARKHTGHAATDLGVHKRKPSHWSDPIVLQSCRTETGACTSFHQQMKDVCLE